MAEQKLLTQATQLTPTGAPRPMFASPAYNVSGIVSALNKFVDRELDKKSKRVARESALAGRNAALSGDFKVVEKETVAARAYNAAGLETLNNTATVRYSQLVDKMKQEPDIRADPDNIQKRSIAVASEIAAGLPKEVRPLFLMQAQRIAGDAILKANENKASLVLEANKAAWEGAELKYLTDISNAAENGDAVSVDMLRASYFRAMEAQGSLETGGTGVLSEKIIESKKVNVTRIIAKQAVIGEFRRLPDSQRLDYIHDLEDGNALEGVMEADDKNKVIDALYADMNRDLVIQNRLTKAAKDANDKIADDLAKKTMDDPTEENLALARPHVKASMYNTLRKIVRDAEDEDRPEVLKETTVELMQGTLTREKLIDLTGNGLSPKKVLEYHGALLTQQNKYPFVTSSDWKEAVRRVDADFPVEKGLLGYLRGGPKMEAAKNRVLTRMYDTVKNEWNMHQEDPAKNPRPDILRAYQLISAPELEKMKADEATPQQSALVKKYSGNPEQLRIDIETGAIGSELGKQILEQIKKSSK